MIYATVKSLKRLFVVVIVPPSYRIVNGTESLTSHPTGGYSQLSSSACVGNISLKPISHLIWVCCWDLHWGSAHHDPRVASGPWLAFVNEVLSEHSHTHFFVYHIWPLCGYNGTTEWLEQRPYGLKARNVCYFAHHTHTHTHTQYLLPLIYVKFQVRNVFEILEALLNLFYPQGQQKQNTLTASIFVLAARELNEN